MSAVISDCGTYRYALKRSGSTGSGGVLFVMLNPSTADASLDDPTIRRCIGFARCWGFRDLAVANLYAYRATDPHDLDDAAGAGVDPVGPDNDEWIARLAASATQIIVAWGAKASAKREREVLEILGSEVLCLGQTQSGAPKHPLFLKADTRRRALKGPGFPREREA